MFSINLTGRSSSRSISNKKRPLNTTRSTSFIKKELHVNLYDLPKIPSYYKLDRPAFSKETRKDI